MNDQERLAEIREKLSAIEGLDELRYERLAAALNLEQSRDGYDDKGRFKIVMYDAKSYDVESFERSNRGLWDIKYLSASLNEDTAPAATGYKAICIFVNDRCHAKVVERLAACGVEIIALRCAGFNNVDLDACAEHGISVVHVPAYSPHAVAEHAVGLMLMLNRNLHRAYYRNKLGYFMLDGLTGFDMHGKIVGVVGTGKIGQCLVDILLGFGCQVLAFDKHPKREFTDRSGVEYAGLDRLYNESDIISLHVPLFPETHHMIDKAAIDRMKPGVMLINTSRGALVDTKALIAGLKSKKIGAAGLDVYEEEAGVFFHNLENEIMTDDVLARLMTFNNVVVTSHQGFLTEEALSNIADTTLANILEYKQGQRGTGLSNRVLRR